VCVFRGPLRFLWAGAGDETVFVSDDMTSARGAVEQHLQNPERMVSIKTRCSALFGFVPSAVSVLPMPAVRERNNRLLRRHETRTTSHGSSRRCKIILTMAQQNQVSAVNSPEGKIPSGMIAKFALGLAFGLVTGVIGSMVGLGGGVVLTPLLTGFLGMSQHMAHGTSLFAVSFVTAFGGLAYFNAKTLSIGLALVICISALISVRFGSSYALQINAKRLKSFFAMYLIFAAALLQLQPYLKKLAAQQAASTISLTLASATQCVGLGTITGFVSGLLGVGGGTILLPGLTLLLGMAQKTAQGTALAATAFPSLLGASSYIAKGSVSVSLLPGILPGVIIGAMFGGSLAVGLSDATLRLLCGAVLFTSGIRSLLASRDKSLSQEKGNTSQVSIAPEGYLFLSAAKLHYKIENPHSHDLPLVLLHMAPRSEDEYREFVAAARECKLERTLVLFDLVGYGSSVAESNITIEQQGTLIVEALDALGFSGKVDIFGHLFGAYVAMSIAANRPNKVNSVILVDPLYFDADTRRSFRSLIEPLQMTPDPEGRFLTQLWQKRSNFATTEMNTRFVTDELRSAAGENSALLSVSSFPLEAILPKVECPVMIIWAKQAIDEFDQYPWNVKKNLPLVEQGLSNCQVCEIADAHYDSINTHAKFFAEKAKDFLERTKKTGR